MKQHITVLVTRQDELSKVYESRRKTADDSRNHMTIFTTENTELNEKTSTIVIQIADQIAQAKGNDEDANATVAITSLENDQAKKILAFFFVHNFVELPNGSSSTEFAKPDCQDQESAHGPKIAGPTKDQLGSLYSTFINLEDLQWTSQQREESFRRYFLACFTSCIDDLRASENYYAAETARYTTIQYNLLLSVAVSRDERQRPARFDSRPSLKFNSNEKLQSYRVILPDKDGNVGGPSKDTKKAATDDKSTLPQANSLLTQGERLRKALQEATDFNAHLLKNSEANLKELLAAEADSDKKTTHDGGAHLKNLEKLKLTEISNLRAKQRLLEDQRRVLEQGMEQLTLRKEDFARYQQLVKDSLREERSLLNKQRHCSQQDRRDLLAQKDELERLDVARADKYRGKERSLEGQRRDLEQDKHEFIGVKEDFERTNELNAIRMRQKESLLEKQRMDLEYTKLELLAEKERLRQQEIANANSLQEKEAMLKRDYEAKIGRLRELNASMENQRRGLERYQRELLERKEEVDAYCEAQASSLREQERTMDRRRRDLDRDRNRLEQREERQQRDSARTTVIREPVVVEVEKKKDYIEIPIIPTILSWKINWPPKLWS